MVHFHELPVSPPQTPEFTLFGSPNNASISSELMPWCTFNIFSVVNDEGKADVLVDVVGDVVGVVTQEESENSNNK